MKNFKKTDIVFILPLLAVLCFIVTKVNDTSQMHTLWPDLTQVFDLNQTWIYQTYERILLTAFTNGDTVAKAGIMNFAFGMTFYTLWVLCDIIVEVVVFLPKVCSKLMKKMLWEREDK